MRGKKDYIYNSVVVTANCIGMACVFIKLCCFASKIKKKKGLYAIFISH